MTFEQASFAPIIWVVRHSIRFASLSIFLVLRLFLLSSQQLRAEVSEWADPVTSVSLSHDNNCLLVGCLDSTLRLLDRSSGELLGEYARCAAAVALGLCT
jgi:WD40 repeat protein